MSTNRNQKAYIRIDGSGRDVAGSLILRNKKPGNGKWREVLAYECCNFIPNPQNPAFIITVNSNSDEGSQTDGFILGTSPDYAGQYNFTIKTSDGQVIDNVTDTYELTFPSPGIYDIEITGDFPAIKMRGDGNDVDSDEKKIIDVKNWGTIPFVDMSGAFEGCINMVITATDTPNMSNVTSMNSMFNSAESLINVPNLKSWDVSNVENMEYLFYECSSLVEVDISDWNVQNVIDDDGINEMFEDCGSLVTVNMDNWYLKNLEGVAESIFYSGMDSLTTVSMKNWRLGPNVNNIDKMFPECPVLTTVDMSNWTFDNPDGVQMGGIFDECPLLSDLKIDVILQGNARRMFKGCFSLQSYTGTIDVSNVNRMDEMFQDANIFNQDISSWDTSSVGNMTDMFNAAITFNQDLSGWNVQVVGQCLNFDEATLSWALPKPNFTSCSPTPPTTTTTTTLI